LRSAAYAMLRTDPRCMPGPGRRSLRLGHADRLDDPAPVIAVARITVTALEVIRPVPFRTGSLPALGRRQADPA